jgi:hypothetical protein
MHFHGKGLAQHTLCILCLGVVISVLADSPNKGNDQTFQEAAIGTIRVAFSPNSGATKLVTDTIHQAKKADPGPSLQLHESCYLLPKLLPLLRANLHSPP